MPPERTPTAACPQCLARSALLRVLGVRIEHAARDLSGLLALLALDDLTLIDAVGGARKQELRERRGELLAAAQAPAAEQVRAICPHSPGFPPPPTLLHFAGELDCLRGAIEQPLVAFLGARRASEYGRQLAVALASELARAGVTIVALFAEGIAAAALSGALDAGGAPLAVQASGLDVMRPAHLDGLRRRLRRDGCLVSELSPGARERRWTARASGRTVVSIAQLVIVLEGQIDGPELEIAALARSQGAILAATPGRVGSPNAQGPHALLRDGATLVRDAQDALDLLYGAGSVLVPARTLRLEDRLARVLERVAAGEDTLERLIAAPEAAETLLAVGELEAVGLLSRGATGRYMPRV